jgi:protein gp37
MADATHIEWADATWNPWYGCKKISPGCKNCYMYREMKHYGRDPFTVTRSKTKFSDPLKWANKVRQGGHGPKTIFTCSWSDFFIEQADAWRAEVWDIIRRTPEFVYLILTKRVERMENCLPADWGNGYPNVALGVSAEDQLVADYRVRHLLHVPAMWRFVSLEPLLSEISLTEMDLHDRSLLGEDANTQPELTSALEPFNEHIYTRRRALDWVIAGGESGPDARPILSPRWIRTLRNQCAAFHVPFFFKQWGEFAPIQTANHTGVIRRVGREAAGNLLDGQVWQQTPWNIPDEKVVRA